MEKCLFIILALISIRVASFARASQPTTIKVHIVDGKTGKFLQAHQLLIHLDHLETDKNGWIEIPADINESMQFVDLDNLYRCEVRKQSANYVSYTVKEIVRHGIVSKNFCGNHQAAVTPGVVVLYMRHPHWWESTKDFGAVIEQSAHK